MFSLIVTLAKKAAMAISIVSDNPFVHTFVSKHAHKNADFYSEGDLLTYYSTFSEFRQLLGVLKTVLPFCVCQNCASPTAFMVK